MVAFFVTEVKKMLPEALFYFFIFIFTNLGVGFFSFYFLCSVNGFIFNGLLSYVYDINDSMSFSYTGIRKSALFCRNENKVNIVQQQNSWARFFSI